MRNLTYIHSDNNAQHLKNKKPIFLFKKTKTKINELMSNIIIREIDR